jgi:hypothetical protein
MNVFAGFLDLINETIDSVGGLSGVLMALGSVLLNTFSTDIIAGLNGMETAFMGMTQKGRSALQAF